MDDDLTKDKGYTVEPGTGKIIVTYQTDRYRKATNDTNAKIEIVIKVTNNTFEIDETETDTGVTIASMYEDLAEDEEGATEGMVHIGDYVNYNPNPDNMATTAMIEANRYRYVSKSEETGLGDAITANYEGLETPTSTSQDFTVQEGTKWRVLGIDGGRGK